MKLMSNKAEKIQREMGVINDIDALRAHLPAPTFGNICLGLLSWVRSLIHSFTTTTTTIITGYPQVTQNN